MALHRDIYWIGRQWSVTGYGIQFIDQRLRGVFDIEIAKLRDNRVLDAMRAHDWLKADDFEKAIAAAHKRFPEPARPSPDQQGMSETLLQPSEPVTSVPANASAPAISPPPLVLGSESVIIEAALPSKPAMPVEPLTEPVPPTSPAAVNPPPPALGLRVERAIAEAELPMTPALAFEPAFVASEPVVPAPAKLPLFLELRRESERARADLQSKMSALDGLLRSRGVVAAPPVMPQSSIPAVQAEGELAKFAPQWRVRN